MLQTINFSSFEPHFNLQGCNFLNLVKKGVFPNIQYKDRVKSECMLENCNLLNLI